MSPGDGPARPRPAHDGADAPGTSGPDPPRDPADGRPAPQDRTAEILSRGGKVDQEALAQVYAAQTDDEDERPVTVRFRLQRDLEKRLDRYLVDRIPFLSRTSLQRLIRESAVTVNGRPAKASTTLRAGDEIVAILPPPPTTEIPAEDIPIRVLYEDADLLVLDKHADIIVHPARGNLSGTLLNAIAWHFRTQAAGALSSVGESMARPGIVHRLDRFTTGAMVVAKSDLAHWRLARQFEQRRVEKRYLAVVHGVPEPANDVIDLPIGAHPLKRLQYAVRWDDLGKSAVTLYRVLESFGDMALVELELRTGRTHQIRVHLSHLGYPIVGDDLYGGRHVTVGDVAGAAGVPGRSPREPLMTRQALHAALLGFEHPIMLSPARFLAPVPPDMQALLEVLRATRTAQRLPATGALLDASGGARRQE
ncbi:MAG: RluA family pseudouridine synthase [Phycisphaeraceae bacterium]|nr:RluA family pseudouridine synthase [Phycisphaeraceae bacterium]